MSAALQVAALRLVANNVNLLRASFALYLACDFSTRNSGSADGGGGPIVHHKDLVESDRIPLLHSRRELFNENRVALSDDVLLPAGLYHGQFHVQRIYHLPR